MLLQGNMTPEAKSEQHGVRFYYSPDPNASIIT